MKAAKWLYLMGTISFGIICGAGHTAFELLGEKPVEVAESMQNLSINLLGKETNMLVFVTGMSLLMGVMLFAYGVINLLVIFRENRLTLPSDKIIIANILVSLVAVVLIYQYLFIVPLVFTGLALGCFSIAYVLKKQKA